MPVEPSVLQESRIRPRSRFPRSLRPSFAPAARRILSCIFATTAALVLVVGGTAQAQTPPAPTGVRPSEEPDAGNGRSAIERVAAGPDMTVNKSHTGNFTVGLTGSYAFSVRNVGDVASTGAVTIVDTLPPGLQYVSSSGVGWNIVHNAGVVLASRATSFAPNAASNYSITVFVLASALPGVTNKAEVVGGGDVNLTNNIDLDPTIVVGLPDLALDKSHVGSFTVGTNGTYTIQLANVGTGSTTGAITVTDSLPAGLTFLGASAGWSASVNGQVVALTRATPIPASQSATLTIDVAVAPAAAPLVTNVAFVQTPGDFVPGNNRDTDPTDVIPVPDLALDKRHTGAFDVGQTGTYTFVVTNGGGAATSGAVAVRDTLPTGLTFAGGAGALWSFATAGQIVTATRTTPIAAGDTAGFTLDVNVASLAIPGVVNTAVVTAVGDPNLSDNRDVDPTPVVGVSDLALEKRHIDELVVGQNAVYEVLVRSTGTAPATGPFVVTDDLPAALEFVSAAGTGWSFVRAGQTVTATHPGPLAPGNGLVFTLTATVMPAAVPVVFNTADVAVAFTDPTPINNSDADVAFVTGLGTLAVALRADPGEVELGDPVDWSLTVRDDDDGPVPGVIAAVTLPDGFRYLPGTARLGGVAIADPVEIHSGAVAARTLEFAAGDLAAGATATVTFRTRTGAAAATSRGVATATARTAAGPPFDVASNTASAEVRIRGGVFADDATIAGTVTVAGDATSPTLGVPGVRVVLEDGTAAITDGEGRYHFANVRPRTHVLRVDPATLPAGAKPVAASARDAGEPGSRFADVKSGELYRADFFVASGEALKSNLRDLSVIREGESRAQPGADLAGAEPAPILTGVIEGRLDVRDLEDGELGGARRDRFEDELHDLSGGSDDGRTTASGHGALFARGDLAGARVTVRYDSERDADRRLFRDIRPLEGYDTYGDASLQEPGAQSTSRLFARIERGASFAQVGDFVTPGRDARSLGAYTRSLNGGSGRLATGRLTLGGFASEGRSRQVVDEFRGRGTSGPYALTRADGKLGSEIVEIVVRDRDRPARVVRRETLARHADYVLEPFTGRLLLKRPLPAFDEQLNPVSVRVSYEAEAGDGEEFKVYGADGRIALGSGAASAADSAAADTNGVRLELGGSAARDEDPALPIALMGGDVTLRVGSTFSMQAEIAHSDSAGDGFGTGDTQGSAGRAEMRVGTAWLDARAHGTRVERQFLNPSAAELRGRQELGFTARTPIPLSSSLFAEGLWTEDLITDGRRKGIQAGLARLSRHGVATEIAYRWAQESATPASFETATRRATPATTNSMRGRASAEVPAWRPLSVLGELEQDLNESHRRRALLGADVRVTDATRFYARHEYNASFAGPWAMNSAQRGATTVFGFAGDTRGGLHAFSEYRSEGAFAGRETQAVLGLRDRWTLRDGLHVDGSLERLTAMRGSRPEATAVTGAVEYTADSLWKGSLRTEFRTQEDVENWLVTSGVARRIGRDWATLVRTTWFSVPDEDRLDARSQAGIAWRQTGGAWNALARYENRHERTAVGTPYRRNAHITSAHANWQPVSALTLNGRFASKWGRDENAGVLSTSETKLAQGRATIELGRRYDLGFIGRGLFGDGGETRLTGVGVEAGAVVMRNLRVYAGYNVFGFHDDDLSEDRTDRGPYAGFGLKVDEKLFGFGGGD